MKVFYIKEEKIIIKKSLPEMQLHQNTCQNFFSKNLHRFCQGEKSKSASKIPVEAVSTSFEPEAVPTSFELAAAPTSSEAVAGEASDLEPTARTATTSGFFLAVSDLEPDAQMGTASGFFLAESSARTTTTCSGEGAAEKIEA